jgi:hypothetical protein
MSITKVKNIKPIAAFFSVFFIKTKKQKKSQTLLNLGFHILANLTGFKNLLGFI